MGQREERRRPAPSDCSQTRTALRRAQRRPSPPTNSAARRTSSEGARSNILTTFRLLPGLAYDPLHDAMKQRGYVIYAGQGDIRTYAFRVSNMGTLTPRDMEGVVDAFRASLAELAVGAGR